MATSTCVSPSTTRMTPKRAPTREAAGEKLLHAFGTRVGGHVVVGRLAPQHEVAHAAADEVGLVAGGAQRAADLCG